MISSLLNVIFNKVLGKLKIKNIYIVNLKQSIIVMIIES